MALVLCPADRLDVLAGQLLDALARSDDPMVNDLVLVHAPATQRYLSQYVASHNGHGICSGVRFTSIPGLRSELAEAAGLQAEAWTHTAVSASIGSILAENPSWATPVLDHLGTGQDRPGRRIVTIDRLARLLLHYVQDCPALVRAWNRGELVGPSESAPGDDADEPGHDATWVGAPLHPSNQWQFHLWRAVRADLGEDPDQVNQTLCHLLLERPSLVDQLAMALPEQMHVVCTGAISDADLALLESLACGRDVLVHLLHHQRVELPLQQPADGAGEAQPAAGAGEGTARFGHRLDQQLDRTWQQLLTVAERIEPAPLADRADSLLGALQRSVVTGRAHPHGPDDSLQVHQSHGPDRQVEVLGDIVCGLLQDDPSLEPRDIVVVSPDLNRFAPLVQQRLVLDGEDPQAHPARSVRLVLSDPQAVPEAPVHALLQQVLHLPSTRATAEDLFELCTMTAVSPAFGFGQDDGSALRDLIDQAGIRWGIDARHRREFGLGTTRQTWFHGLQRLTLGATMASAPVPLARGASGTTGVQYLDDSRVHLVAGLDQFVSAIRKALAASQDRLDAQSWVAVLGELVTQLVGSNSAMAPDAAMLRQRLAQWASAQSPQATFTRAELGLVLGEFAGWQRSRPSFGTGSLVVTGLDQLGAVPHRVVIVLGLDDEVFPGPVRVLGDDLLTVDARSRQAAQQHLFNAVMAATERCILVHQGFDPVTLIKNDPPVALSELLALARQATGTCPQPTSWPVQEHDPGNFGPDARSFDQRAHRGALARAQAQVPAQAQIPAQALAEQGAVDQQPVSAGPAASGPALLTHGFEPIEPVTDRQGRIPMTLVELESFYRNPLRSFLQQRINARLSEFSRDISEELPLVVDGLTKWKIKDAAIAAALTGSEPEDLPTIVAQAGLVPESEPFEQVQALTSEAMDYVRGLPQTTPTRVQDAIATAFGPVHLTGQVPVFRGARFATKTSKVQGDDVLLHWLGALLLAGATAEPAHLVMHSLRGTRRFTTEDPQAHLRWLVELALHGRSHPMPVLPRVMYLLTQHPRDDRALEDAYRQARRDVDTATFLPPALKDYLELSVTIGADGIGAGQALVGQSRLGISEIASAIFDPIQEVRSEHERY